jgi:hypothetical protein
LQGGGLTPHVDYFTHVLWRQLARGPVINAAIAVSGATVSNINVTMSVMCFDNDGVSKASPPPPPPRRATTTVRLWRDPACWQGGALLAYTNVDTQPVALPAGLLGATAAPITEWVLTGEPSSNSAAYSGVLRPSRASRASRCDLRALVDTGACLPHRRSRVPQRRVADGGRLWHGRSVSMHTLVHSRL